MGVQKYDHDKIIALYADGLSTREVASEVGCGKTIVSEVVSKYGISRPNRIRTHVIRKRSQKCDEFSDEFSKFLDGLLISDGHLTRPRGRALASVYRQSCVHKEWLENLLDVFKENGLKSSVKPVKNRSDFVLETLSYDNFYSERNRWYIGEEGVKFVPKDVDLGCRNLLRNWICGDGTRIDKCTLRFCTDSFSEDCIDFIQSRLWNGKFKKTFMGMSKKGYPKYRLSLCKRDGLHDFLDYVGKPEFNCFDYKWIK